MIYLSADLIICEGCGWEIDPNVCHCGDWEEGHSWEHQFVPMGCTCGYVDADQRRNPNWNPCYGTRAGA